MSYRPEEPDKLLLLLFYGNNNRGSCQEPLLLGLKFALGNFLNLLPNKVLELLEHFATHGWNCPVKS